MSAALHDPRAFLCHLYDTAVQRALPALNTAAHLPPPPDTEGPRRGRTVVIGAGKAGGAMAAAVDALWPAAAPLSGLVVTRYDHVPPAYRARPGRIEVVEARHPVPDEAGRQAAQRIAAMVQGLTEHDLVLCLVSGGGSALLSLPAPGLTLEDKQAINRALLKSGAAIDEMNCVRKHLSAIKGGRLAALCAPARVVTLLISDVPGDAPEVIASGPTVPDASTCADALAICRRYGIALPPAALAGLESGAFETPKPGDPLFHGHQVHMLATPQQALEAAAEAARAAGVEAHILSDEMEGESRVVGQVQAALARAVARRGAPFAKPCVILSGGETTVTVQGQGGKGGRATEFLLGCAIALQGQPGVHVLAADTDGIDGLEDNAGAIVTPDTLARAAALGLKPPEFLDRHDAYSFFAALGDLVVPGPTYTNVNDFRAVLVN
ncbi:glycerate kinase type-2 family protein [Rubrivivax rivuli]|uniref:Glycerate kinase n=1 Tax=Rubrivivax rivuli TaxID=1862385 RepID=A0A437RL30_9BURK|nr:glycerate kinase [Rubrivivax rivuli]RVU47501.1 glycerate kinase [Rubrivivax rivuli]